MALSPDIIDVVITRSTQALERDGFGKLMVITAHRLFIDRALEVSSTAEIKTAGGSANDPLVDFADAYFNQTPKPKKLILGRWAVGDTTTVTATTVTNSATYTIVVDDQIFTFVADATATAGEISLGLVAAVNGGFAITAAVVATKTFTIAGDHVAEFPVFVVGSTGTNKGQFRVTGSTANNLDYTVVSATLNAGNTDIVVTETVTDATADGVIRPRVTAVDTTDDFTLDPEKFDASSHTDFYEVHGEDKLTLAFTTNETAAAARLAIAQADDSWYGLGITSRLVGDVTGLATDIESLDKLFLTATTQATVRTTTDAADSPVSGSVAAQLKGSSRSKTGVMWSAQAGETGTEKANETWIEASWFGARLTTDAGSETWALTRLSGPVADLHTAAQRTNILAKNANLYEPITSSISVTNFGTVASGEFIDIIRGIAALKSDMVIEIANTLIFPKSPLNKVPYTDEGIATIEAAVRRILQEYTDNGFIAKDAAGIGIFSIEVPTAASISTAIKGTRIFSGLTWTATAAGAIHKVTIAGTVSL